MKRVSVSVGLILLVLVALLIAWPAPARVDHPYFAEIPKGQVEIIAHGGGLGHAPPNTIFALHRAKQMGADVLEVDVQQTRDGKLVLRHDDTLDRTTDMQGLIASKTWSELQFASADPEAMIAPSDSNETGIGIPLFEQALLAFPEMRWVAEIKNDTPQAARAMCEVIQSTGMTAKVLVGSFHDAAMRSFRTECPNVATSMSSSEVRNFVIAARLGVSRLIATPAVAMQIPVESGGIDLTHPRVLDAAVTRGIRVQYWTINDPLEMNRLLEAGADGLITDYVDRGKEAQSAQVSQN